MRLVVMTVFQRIVKDQGLHHAKDRNSDTVERTKHSFEDVVPAEVPVSTAFQVSQSKSMIYTLLSSLAAGDYY